MSEIPKCSLKSGKDCDNFDSDGRRICGKQCLTAHWYLKRYLLRLRDLDGKSFSNKVIEKDDLTLCGKILSHDYEPVKFPIVHKQGHWIDAAVVQEGELVEYPFSLN